MLSPNTPDQGRDRFAVCLRETLKWEGGWSNHPKDTGGATMRGVIQRVYNGYRDGQGLARRSVRMIEESELQDIYRRNYWDLIRGSEQPEGIDLALFDFCVNAGASQSVKSLQRVLGLSRDGHLGAATMAAIQRADPTELVEKYMAERERFYRSLSVFPTFGKGWLSRNAGIKQAALIMAGQSRWDMEPVAAPLPDPDAQSETQGRANAQDPKPPITTEVVLGASGGIGTAQGVANGFAKIAKLPTLSYFDIVLAFLSEPLILMGIVTIVASATTFLWRRRHAQ